MTAHWNDLTVYSRRIKGRLSLAPENPIGCRSTPTKLQKTQAHENQYGRGFKGPQFLQHPRHNRKRGDTNRFCQFLHHCVSPFTLESYDVLCREAKLKHNSVSSCLTCLRVLAPQAYPPSLTHRMPAAPKHGVFRATKARRVNLELRFARSFILSAACNQVFLPLSGDPLPSAHS